MGLARALALVPRGLQLGPGYLELRCCPPSDALLLSQSSGSPSRLPYNEISCKENAKFVCSFLSPLSISMLPCLWPGCPQRFKSQNGRTYHMRTIHVNSNKQPVNIEQIRGDEDRHHRGLPTDDGVPVARNVRIEHPHLTGK